MSMLPSRNRRPTQLQDSDYDHEIRLVNKDRSLPNSRSPSRSRSIELHALERQLASLEAEDDDDQRQDVAYRKKKRDSLRREINRHKYKKYQNRASQQPNIEDGEDLAPEESNAEDYASASVETLERGRPKNKTVVATVTKKKSHDPESAIDVLYENQRGWYLCGLQLFSSKALGAADAPSWTNIANKASATNITNAQPPDPSWEWAWPAWTINHDDNTDDDGWMYSFAFPKMFSWHGPRWYNSFVRRRAWIRKRVKIQNGKGGYRGRSQDINMLSTGSYFDVTSSRERVPRGSHSGGPSRRESVQGSRHSVVTMSDAGDSSEDDEIHDIGTLLKVMKRSRIDREKMEAVENFIQHADYELVYLRANMHVIMSRFIFQNSRRLLLSHLSKIFDEATEHRRKHVEQGKEEEEGEKERIDSLQAAVECADEEVKALEFWSDVRDMAERGGTHGAVDGEKGWDRRWCGLDDSAPKDVITARELPGSRGVVEKDGEEMNDGEGVNGKAGGEGKGKEKEVDRT